MHYLNVPRSGETVWKFGTIGDTFYVILKGEVGIFVPNITEIHLNDFEYIKLINEYGDMILSINGDDKFEIPACPEKVVEKASLIELDDIIYKMDDPEQDAMNSTKSANKNPTMSEYEAFTDLKNWANFENLSEQETDLLRTLLNTYKSYTFKYLKQISVLKAGTSFGELSLMSSKPRLATVRTLCPCEFATLNKAQFDETVGKIKQEEVNSKLEQLDAVPFFREYSRAFKTRLLFDIKIIDFYRHQVVFKEGSEDKNLYFIVKGIFSYKILHKPNTYHFIIFFKCIGDFCLLKKFYGNEFEPLLSQTEDVNIKNFL